MKIQTFGAKFLQGQLPRIDEGFESLGHELADKDADLIYVNDAGGWNQAIKEKIENPHAKLILNLLDIPDFLPECDEIIRTLKSQAVYADAVTCISNTVRQQIKDYLNIDAVTIYNPIKDLTLLDLPRTIPFLYVGRIGAINKRGYLVRQTIEELGMPENSLVVVGSESIGFGHQTGVVSDENLNLIYNSAKYLLFPSFAEGQGLPPIEMLCVSGIPITCYDNPTAHEFCPPQFITEPNPKAIADLIRKIEPNYKEEATRAYEKYGEKYTKQFDKVQIARNILEVYEKNLR